jgi:hypothetical protein
MRSRMQARLLVRWDTGQTSGNPCDQLVTRRILRMHIAEDLPDLDDRLALARAEEAEALRRAHHLRAIGSRGEYLEAMRELDASHDAVVRLQGRVGSRDSSA